MLEDRVVEHVADGAPGRLGAVDDAQDGPGGLQARSRRSASRSRTTVAFSLAPSARPRGTFVPSRVMPRATTQVCSAT
jgi:hypothetical protein